MENKMADTMQSSRPPAPSLKCKLSSPLSLSLSLYSLSLTSSPGSTHMLSLFSAMKKLKHKVVERMKDTADLSNTSCTTNEQLVDHSLTHPLTVVLSYYTFTHSHSRKLAHACITAFCQFSSIIMLLYLTLLK